MFWEMRKFITDVLGHEEIPYNMKLYPCTEIVKELMLRLQQVSSMCS